LAEKAAVLDPQFETLEQQHETRTFGMWIFLVTELMLFGAMFTMYTVYRSFYSEAFAEGSRRLDLLLGGINTAVLIVSSLCMALAVHAARTNTNRIPQTLWLAATGALGTLFLVIKGYEYYLHYLHGEVPALNFQVAGPLAGQVQLFFWLYFAMTGVHAIHLIIGIGVVGIMVLRALLGHFRPNAYTPVELTGLYWHFIDIVWIFLLPLLYLISH
jgi:cytochrome c oxidase subunit III